MPRKALCTNYSAQGRKCVVATAIERSTAQNTIDHNLSAPVCAVCTQMRFLLCLRRHGWHVRWWETGAVYEIFYLEFWRLTEGAAQLVPWQCRKNIKQLAVGVKVENIIDVCLFFLKLLPSGQSISHIWVCNSWKQ